MGICDSGRHAAPCRETVPVQSFYRLMAGDKMPPKENPGSSRRGHSSQRLGIGRDRTSSGLLATGSILNRWPMPVGAGSMRRSMPARIVSKSRGVGAGESLRSGSKPESEEHVALACDRSRMQPGLGHVFRECLEIHMAVMSASPGSAKGSTKRWAFTACRVSPWAGVVWP